MPVTKPTMVIAEGDHDVTKPMRLASLVDLLSEIVGGDLSAESVP